MDYTKYTDTYIRNKDELNREEQELADLQATEEVENFLKRFAKEPKFFNRIVAPKLAQRLVSHLEHQE